MRLTFTLNYVKLSLIAKYRDMRKEVIAVLMVLIAIEGSTREIVEKMLEPALLEVRYERRKVLDTLDIENDYRIDFLTLKIGKSKSAFYSAELKTVDSIEYRHGDRVLERMSNEEWNGFVANLPNDAVFKNYPEGKIRVLDRFDFSEWRIDEDWEKPVWNITDSISNFMGYECVMAETDYRGRKWIAWFTLDIPIADGPWKLSGLPGLILSAYDSMGHYQYKAVGINNQNIGYVEYFDYDAGGRIPITREKALPRKRKYLKEDVRYIVLSSGMYGITDPSIKRRNKIPHRNYDFEETDYPHE